MTNSLSSSKLLISQEIENPSSFNLSIPLPEESLSAPVCGAGEMGESITPHTKIVASPAPPSREVLPCSPTLVLFGEKSQNSEAQSVVKPSGDLPTEEVEVYSTPVSSTMSEQLFDGDLPEGRGPNEEEEEEEAPLKQSRKGVRSANFLTLGVLDLEGFNIVHVTYLNNEPSKSTKQRKIKGKGKMVTSYTKEGQEEMERDRKRRRECYLSEEPTSTPLHVGSSDTESYDAAVYVVKRRKEAEVDKKVSKRDTKQSKPIKVPCPHIQKPVEEKEMTREEQIEEMENQKVLNGRVFNPDILIEPRMSTLFDSVSLQSWDHLFKPLTPYLHEPEVRISYYQMELLDDGEIRTIVKDVKIHLDEETLGIILGVPMKGIWSIEGCKPSSGLTTHATKRAGHKASRSAKEVFEEGISTIL
ncbi:hypothetical protein H5410_037132 [Solanum commersonii]|uniref:Uncharacterized protein n=1 Tax=Solanum commersonii TaxID=4109 RepID=A0A9J5Y9D0_SOLCO|nr:hypothetical protein H5410_037132 [Solanum commersonii]